MFSAEPSIERKLSSDFLYAGDILEVSLHIDFSSELPDAFILTENFSASFTYLSSSWNGLSFPASLASSNSLKWLFCFSSVKPAPGILRYYLQVNSNASSLLNFQGNLSIDEKLTYPIFGASSVCINPEPAPTITILPDKEKYFTDEITISIDCESSSNYELYFCTDNPQYFYNWQLYEEPFSIKNSTELIIDCWQENGPGATITRQFFRECSFEWQLQKGWNFVGIPIELDKESKKTLKNYKVFNEMQQKINLDKIKPSAGQCLWIFSQKTEKLILSGSETIKRSEKITTSKNWTAFTIVGFNQFTLPNKNTAAYSYQNNSYKPITKLQSGKAYWLVFIRD